MTDSTDLALFELRRCESDHGEWLWGPLKTPEMGQVLDEKRIEPEEPVIQGLPTKVLRMIFEHVDRPMDKLHLAVTCRQFFRVASDLNLSVLSTARHRDQGGDCICGR
ncbi:unnamed protein product [Clonostachys solani]|uniref:F-box domain-containing protein n=1 Tax=Clonostachys solani TaxID=160281 RepID=A0A9N9YZP2_9HYPO|nr:unnamed protein product [Clonostachys solani]